MRTPAPFGRLITAMITPFAKDGSIDWDGVATLATHLADHGHDAIAVNGTTGEAPTTKSSEKLEIIKVVKSTVGSRVKVLSGAGDNETSYTVEQAKRSADAGADGLLIVTPYYNKPPQAGIEAHFKAVASATDLPIMMYDIPGRTGVEIESDTIVRLFELPNIVALKDAKGNLAATSDVIARCGIPVYSGDDILNLPFLSIGAVGFVSVCGHTVGTQLKEMLDAWFAGDTARALEIHQRLIPVFKGTFKRHHTTSSCRCNTSSDRYPARRSHRRWRAAWLA